MRILIISLGVFLMFNTAAHAGPPVHAMAVECNWGTLTMEAIRNGFDQGMHASDPSGDGHGPGTVDEPRAGLANVVTQGDLEALCELIDSLLP